MKYFWFPFRLIWRLWFYILLFVSILVMTPFLLVLLSKDKYYNLFWKVIRAWSFFLIYSMGFYLKIDKQEKTDPKKSYVFIANHASLLDPWIMVAINKNPLLFVGKKELEKLPLFGFFYKKAVITVDRSDPESRKKVYASVKKRLETGLSVAIFPEGLVPTENIVLAPFTNGAFSLAIEYQIPIITQVYYDAKRYFSWNFFKGSPGILRVKQLKFINTKGLTNKDRVLLKENTFNTVYKELSDDKKYMKDTHRNGNEKEYYSPL